jgi:hypothetical protein
MRFSLNIHEWRWLELFFCGDRFVGPGPVMSNLEICCETMGNKFGFEKGKERLNTVGLQVLKATRLKATRL